MQAKNREETIFSCQQSVEQWNVFRNPPLLKVIKDAKKYLQPQHKAPTAP